VPDIEIAHDRTKSSRFSIVRNTSCAFQN